MSNWCVTKSKKKAKKKRQKMTKSGYDQGQTMSKMLKYMTGFTDVATLPEKKQWYVGPTLRVLLMSLYFIKKIVFMYILVSC